MNIFSLHKGWTYKTDTPKIEVVRTFTKGTRLLEAACKVNSQFFHLSYHLIRRTWQTQLRWCNFTSIHFYLVTWSATIMCCLFLSLKSIFSFSSIMMWIIVICLPIMDCVVQSSNVIALSNYANRMQVSFENWSQILASPFQCGWILLT